MGAFYTMSGSVKVQYSDDVENIIERFNEEGGGDLSIESFLEKDGETAILQFGGGVYCSYSTIGELDGIAQELGSFTIEPGLISYEVDGEDGKLYIGRAEFEIDVTSRAKLSEIKDLVSGLTDDHLDELVVYLQDVNSHTKQGKAL